MSGRAIAAACLLGGWMASACATSAGHTGAIAYTTEPRGVLADYCEVMNSSHKVYSILGLVTWGDGSIQDARQVDAEFRLSRIASVDTRVARIFGIGYSQTIVCGFFR
jgi:hypothetical protein